MNWAGLGLLALLANAITLMGCGYAGTPPNEKPIVVKITPSSANLAASQTQQFSAQVSGTSNTGVTWEVNGTAGGSATTGTISTTGLFTAPGTVASASVTVTALSVADPTSTASAVVTLQSSVVEITLTPTSATVPASGAQVLTAATSGGAGGSQQIAWSVDGVAGGSPATGTVASTGALTAVYTAPAALPAQNPVTVTAAMTADPSKSASATVTISCLSTNTIAPSSVTVSLGQTQAFTASICAAAGSSVVWDVNGIVGGNLTVGTISSGGANAATYTAPSALPVGASIVVHATAGGASAAADVALVGNVSVTVSPSSASLAPSQSIMLTPSVSGSTDANVTWSVNGVANGNLSVGQICQSDASPCVAPGGAAAGSVTYLAPAPAPAQNPVYVVAASQADPSRSGTAEIEIQATTSSSGLSVEPLYAFVAATGGAPSTQQFFALASDGTAAAVTWSVASGVPGAGCSGAACGTVNANGVFTAPPSAPSPNAISVIATASGVPAVSMTAMVAIKTGPTIEVLLPSSVTAGAVEGFPLEVQGLNFVAGASGAGSTLLINGASRITTCGSTSVCATALAATDVAVPGTLTVQIQNPGGALSNPVPVVVVPFSTTASALPLTSAQPTLWSIQFAVTEATSSASGAPINVDFIGALSGPNNCNIGAAPLTVTRPSSGTATFSICVQGNGLDPTFSYSFGGPAGALGGTDVPLTATAVAGLLPNMIELSVEVSSSTEPGLRTLLITTLNGDRAAATGMLEIQ